MKTKFLLLVLALVCLGAVDAQRRGKKKSSSKLKLPSVKLPSKNSVEKSMKAAASRARAAAAEKSLKAKAVAAEKAEKAEKSALALLCKLNPKNKRCPKPKKVCCKAMTKTCLACAQGVTVPVFCAKNIGKFGCPGCKSNEFIQPGYGCRPCRNGPYTCNGTSITKCSATKYVDGNVCKACPARHRCNGATAISICCKALTKTCLACQRGVSVPVFCAKNVGKFGCAKYDPKDYHMKEVSNHYQVAKFPYLKVGSLNMKGSAKECENQCHTLENCKYGTFVPKIAHHVDGLPEYDTPGECWLSDQTHAKNYECGVDCYGFAKLHNALPKAVQAIPAPKKVEKKCTCDPFKHPSAFTHCHVKLGSFDRKKHIQVTHASVHFRKAQHRGGEKHVCRARKSAAGVDECECCDCRADGTDYGMLHLGMSMYAIAKPYLPAKLRVGDAKACRKACSNRKNCKGGVFMPETKSGQNCVLSTRLMAAPKHCNGVCDSFVRNGDAAKAFFQTGFEAKTAPKEGEEELSRFHR